MKIEINPTRKGSAWCFTWERKKKKVKKNFNQHSVNNTFSNAMEVAITSNAAIKTNSNAAFIHCCNHTAFCRVEGGKQSRAEELRREEGNQALSPVLAASLKMQRSYCLYTFHTGSHFLVSTVLTAPPPINLLSNVFHTRRHLTSI